MSFSAARAMTPRRNVLLLRAAHDTHMPPSSSAVKTVNFWVVLRRMPLVLASQVTTFFSSCTE